MSPGLAEAEMEKDPVPPPILASDDSARFADFCKELGIDAEIESDAIALFRECKSLLLDVPSPFGSFLEDECTRFLMACAVFCAMRLRKLKEGEMKGKGITLCKILRACKLSVNGFFKEMPHFCRKAGSTLSRIYGSDWEKGLELKELQETTMQLIDLSKFYNKTYKELFVLADMSIVQQSVSSDCCTENSSDFYRFGWFLFLALLNQANSNCKNLVSCTNALVSILVMLILHVPVHFRRFSIQDHSRFAKQLDTCVDLLASLCYTYHTSEEDLKKELQKINQIVVDKLNKKPRLASESKAESLDHINRDGLTYFENLMEEKSLKSSLSILEKDQDDALASSYGCDLDGRLFIDSDDRLLGTGSSTVGATPLYYTKRKHVPSASPSRGYLNSSDSCSLEFPQNVNQACNSVLIPITPVRVTMTTAKWLRDVISPLPSKPSAELDHFLSSCGPELASYVRHRANIILEAVFPSSSFRERSISVSLQSASMLEDVSWAQERKLEALKLYYRVLEAVCQSESKLLNDNNLSTLLSNERFHRCMLACSAELVLATHKTVMLMFPAVLERTGLTAFDLSKVIEVFIRHEATLPRELKRHLNSLEERLLDSMAWEKGSSLYNSLVIARPALASEINRLGLLAEPMPSLDAIAIHHDIPISGPTPLPSQTSDRSPDYVQSPKRLRTEQRSSISPGGPFLSPHQEGRFTSLKAKSVLLQSAFASPTQPNFVGAETSTETAIKIFINKIMKLAAVRIRSLCERLELKPQIIDHAYSLVQKILVEKTALFFNRHVDQILLCSLYVVAKVCHLDLTFRNIVNSYKKQPQCKPLVFRSVFVGVPSANGNGRMVEEHVDIITFYNQIYIPLVKPLLVELVPNGVASEGQEPGSPKFSPLPKLPDMSPKKVSASHNVYVSPLRQTKMDTLLSPSSKSLYACIGESTRAFQSPSSDLTVINNRLNWDNGRRINGRLNFDVVSDSIVANILGHGNSISNSGSSAAPKLPTSEKPDDT